MRTGVSYMGQHVTQNRRGLLISAHDFGPRWIELASQAGLTTLGLHPVPGTPAEDPRSLEALLERMKTPAFRDDSRTVKDRGIELTVEAHALHWLLPRQEFASRPEWFRMDEEGVRTPDLNLCPSNGEALDRVASRTARIASLLGEVSGGHRYHLWMDDNSRYCHCPACRALTASDQALLVYNRMVEGLRTVDPQGTLAYLAYQGTLTAPTKVAPGPGLFLEFAPVDRDSRFPLGHPDIPANRTAVSSLPDLFAAFGQEGSQVLEYWMDDSYFYRWTRPYGELPFYRGVLRSDAAFYRRQGFQNLTSFACGLDQEYEQTYGVPPVQEYGQIVREAFR